MFTIETIQFFTERSTLTMATATATPTQDSLEAQLFEAASALAAIEKTLADPLNNVTIAPDLETDTVSVAVTLPIAVVNVGGQMTITAVPYA